MPPLPPGLNPRLTEEGTTFPADATRLNFHF